MNILKGMEFIRAIQMVLFIVITGRSTSLNFFVNYGIRSTWALCMMLIIVIACISSVIMLIW